MLPRQTWLPGSGRAEEADDARLLPKSRFRARRRSDTDTPQRGAARWVAELGEGLTSNGAILRVES